MFDDYGIIQGCTVAMSSSSTITISAGRMFAKGTEVIVEQEAVAVTLSSSGTKKGRLKAVIDLSNTASPVTWESEVASTADAFQALVQDDDMNFNNGIFEMVVATYDCSETAISNVALVLKQIKRLGRRLVENSNVKLVITNTDGLMSGKVVATCNGVSFEGTLTAYETLTLYCNQIGAYTVTCGSRTRNVAVPYYGEYQVKMNSYEMFSFKVSRSASSPSSMVEYTDETQGMTPAYMNYTTGLFDYGDWEDAFFMPKPCMLTYAGAVSYYLNPDDYTKKADGTSSDVANTAYGGNAMMEWPKVWWKVTWDADYIYYYIADAQVDSNFHCYSNINSAGVEKDHFYTPIFNGSNISSKLRSISGQTPLNSAAGTTEITYATANGTGWYTEIFADRQLINILLMLISKSTDTQTKFGNGHYTGGTAAANLLTTGRLNAKGLFYGTNGTGEAVKVFGMENYWGNQWRRIAGWINAAGTQKIKMTYGTQDGSTAAAFNTDGTGYITVAGATPSGTSGGYINTMVPTSNGPIAAVGSGSSSTYYCDGIYYNNGQTDYAAVGGCSAVGFLCGAFAVSMSCAVSIAGWDIGAAPSYR